jgi:hypothetical protein
MKATSITLLAAAALFATPALAQDAGNGNGTAETQSPDSTPKVEAPAKKELTRDDFVQKIGISRLRPVDQRGINMFETPKKDAVPFTGLAVEFGAAFTQQFQGLGHENTAATLTPTGSTTNANALMQVGHGFNNASANAYINAQLAPGIRVAMTSYLSSRHHNETWVKDGYLLIDESPIDFAPLNKLMQFVTVKAGHFEINYGDSHFRRTDNGNAMYNPFVGNLMLDAMTTEVGGEVYLRNDWGLIAMVSGLGGESRGMVIKPGDRSIAWVSKLGFDRQFSKDLRVRLTGSTFNQPSATSQTLYQGDRGGSRYYLMLENTVATEAGNAWSGNWNPGFGDKLRASTINPFLKYRGLEFFGDFQQSQGRKATETTNRKASQQSYELVYRFCHDERLFVGGRFNTVDATMNLTRVASNLGPLSTVNADVSAQRMQASAGWFITPAVMVKGEYVNQKYNDFPTWDIRNGGKFNGFMIEGVVAF